MCIAHASGFIIKLCNIFCSPFRLSPGSENGFYIPTKATFCRVNIHPKQHRMATEVTPLTRKLLFGSY